MRLGGAGALNVPRTLVDFRDWTAVSGGDQNAAPIRWDMTGNYRNGADTLYTPSGAALPVLTHRPPLGMYTYRLLSNNNSGGFFNNRHGIPLSRVYNNPAQVLPLGAFGPLLRWRWRATLWTETAQPLAIVHYGLLCGNDSLASSVNTTGYEIRSGAGAAWECRRRLVPGGGIETFPIPSSLNSLTPQTWEWTYNEGSVPRLDLRRDGNVLRSFEGQAAMPALNATVVFGAHMLRWHVSNTGVVNAVHQLVGGQYVISAQ